MPMPLEAMPNTSSGSRKPKLPFSMAIGYVELSKETLELFLLSKEV